MIFSRLDEIHVNGKENTFEDSAWTSCSSERWKSLKVRLLFIRAGTKFLRGIRERERERKIDRYWLFRKCFHSPWHVTRTDKKSSLLKIITTYVSVRNFIYICTYIFECFVNNTALYTYMCVENLPMDRAVSMADFFKKRRDIRVSRCTRDRTFMSRPLFRSRCSGRASEICEFLNKRNSRNSWKFASPRGVLIPPIWTNFWANTHSWHVLFPGSLSLCRSRSKERKGRRRERGGGEREWKRDETMSSRRRIQPGRYSFAGGRFCDSTWRHILP